MMPLFELKVLQALVKSSKMELFWIKLIKVSSHLIDFPRNFIIFVQEIVLALSCLQIDQTINEDTKKGFFDGSEGLWSACRHHWGILFFSISWRKKNL